MLARRAWDSRQFAIPDARAGSTDGAVDNRLSASPKRDLAYHRQRKGEQEREGSAKAARGSHVRSRLDIGAVTARAANVTSPLLSTSQR